MVVVSRWYGGILLGPDRFKHINNCARNILVERNYTNSPVSAYWYYIEFLTIAYESKKKQTQTEN